MIINNEVSREAQLENVQIPTSNFLNNLRVA